MTTRSKAFAPDDALRDLSGLTSSGSSGDATDRMCAIRALSAAAKAALLPFPPPPKWGFTGAQTGCGGVEDGAPFFAQVLTQL